MSTLVFQPLVSKNTTSCLSQSVFDSFARRYEYRLWIEQNRLRAWDLNNCRDSIEHWCNYYVFTFDPRAPFSMMPFDLWPKQAELLAWFAERERTQTDGLVEKSRDTGASWICCLYALHAWLFRDGFAAGFGSRKLEYVDEKGNPKSIFEKFRIILRNLPPWMLPDGFKWIKHDCLAKLINPQNGSTITGEGGDSIGRGDRAAIYWVDEAAFLERPQMVESSLSQTTNVRIDVSTPNGPGNPFAQKRHGGKVAVYTLHWRDDPRKDEAWYQKQKERFDAVTVAQEIDIDYTASVEGICIPAAWVRAAVDLHAWSKEHKGIEFPQTEDPVAGLDVAGEGKNKNVFTDRIGVVVREPVAWGQCNLTETAWKAADLAVKRGVKRVNYDGDAIGASIKGTWKTTPKALGFKHNGILGNGSPTDARWPGGKTSKELFLNARAEMWWNLRIRFEKAYEFREKGIAHPVEEMISIPDCPPLIAQLSQPLYHYTNTGKIKIESKDDMRARGVQSPDYADSLAMCFAPNGLWKLTADMIVM